MKGDFTRDTFDARKHFSRVLMQQGRVQLDADWNEGFSIMLHYLQSLAGDLIGPYGGPADIPDITIPTQTAKVNCGFEIIATEARLDEILELSDDEKKTLKTLLKESTPPLLLGKGHYYVDGILCEIPAYVAYADQKGYPFPHQPEKFDTNQNQLIYLDVWERHISCAEVEDVGDSVISIREVALNGPDTATRAQVVWQVKAIDIPTTDPAGLEQLLSDWVNQWQPPNRGWLKARAIKPDSSEIGNNCITPPESRYRGTENQLYRVEIHEGGTAAEGATFKWSRENGSVVFPTHRLGSTSVTIRDQGRDMRLGLQVDDWVEIVDDDYTLQNRAEPLVQIASIVPDIQDPDLYAITFKAALASEVGQDDSKHPLLRRWDQQETEDIALIDGAIAIVEVDTDPNWIELEDGVQIQFQPGAIYRTGDYWLIPARVATGDVEWPGPKNAPEAVEPHGITHHYAPLWLLAFADNNIDPNTDLRRKFKSVWNIP